MILRNLFRFTRFMMINGLMISHASYAEVVLDGTLGPRGVLQGPDFIIDASFGQQMGPNLFHSFESFNLNANESANFIGPTGINNVINRITGGQSSFLDGVLRSFVPNADLYFLNPQGILLGPNVGLNIPGSLYVSTADYLKLGETGHFDVTTPNNSSLTVAPPSAFGFLDNMPANITVEGSLLVLPTDEMIECILNNENIAITTLGLVGGDITIKDAQIRTYGNDVELVSVAAQGEVPINPVELADDTFTSYGTLNITDTGTVERESFGNLDVSGPGGGEIFIRAGQFFLDNGYVFADTWHNKAGRGIIIHATEALTMQNSSRITTESYDPSRGLNPYLTGNGGHITLSANDITLTDGSQIQTSSRTAGNSGNVAIFAQNTLSLRGAIDRNLNSGILDLFLNNVI